MAQIGLYLPRAFLAFTFLSQLNLFSPNKLVPAQLGLTFSFPSEIELHLVREAVSGRSLVSMQIAPLRFRSRLVWFARAREGFDFVILQCGYAGFLSCCLRLIDRLHTMFISRKVIYKLAPSTSGRSDRALMQGCIGG
jgi:hypothetical protein